MSAEFQQLNRLHSLALVGKVLDVQQDPHEAAADSTPFNLDVLHATAKETIEASCVGNTRFLDAPISAMDLLLSKDVIAIPEFDLVNSQFAGAGVMTRTSGITPVTSTWEP